MTSTSQPNPTPDTHRMNQVIAGLAHVFLAASTGESRQRANDLINDLLVAYAGVERASDPRSADEVRQALWEQGAERFTALHDSLPTGSGAHFDNDKEREGVQILAKELEKLGVFAPAAQKSISQESSWRAKIAAEKQHPLENGLVRG